MISAMNQCLEHLTEQGRALLCRRYERGESAPVLGLAFNLSAAAVRQMLVRLRSAVKRCVEGKLGEASR
jgi:DNA-directed RNA polymerase specialized sigma24 family protein